MIIAIDANEANVKQRVGINQFAFAVLKELYQQKNFHFLIFLAQKPLPDLPPEGKHWRYEIFGPKRFWTWTGLPKRLFWGKPKPDVLLSLSHYGPGLSPVPFIICIMDLGFLRFPEQFTKKDFYQLKFWTKWSTERAKKIIAISEFTKKDIIKNYHLDPEKIVVAYPGYQKITDKVHFSLAKKIKGDYILYLGTLKPSKNIKGLLEAFAMIDDQNLKLVVAGKKGWLYAEIFQKVKELNLQKRIIFTDFVPDEQVASLMKGAKLFVLPSFWEGFGIPVLEAMSVGTPVVCSNAGSLPEIVGKAAVLVDPYQPKSISKGINQVLKNEKLRKRMILAGKKQVKKFSWRKCSKIILDEVLQSYGQGADSC